MTTNAGRRRTRVAHVAPQLQTGGMEKLLVEFARHADRERFDLHFISLGTRGSLAGDIEGCGWPVTALGKPPGLRPGLVARLTRLFRCWQVDVVHTHNDSPLLYGAPAARLAGVPVVLHTRHGPPLRASRRLNLAFRLSALLADRVVCVSEDAARLTARAGIAAKKVGTLWNGVDVSRFDFTGARAGGPAVTVARLSPEKDIETLLRAAAVVVRAQPAFRLEVAGDGPCRPALTALTRDLGLAGHVRFLGEVRDVPALLAGASLFVLPSLVEGVSLTLLEAMSRGLPVVATRVGGNPEVVVDGVTGVLVPPRDADALAGAVLGLWGNPERGRWMGLAGRRRVEQWFDVRRMVAGYEALYRRPRGGNGRAGTQTGDLAMTAGGRGQPCVV